MKAVFAALFCALLASSYGQEHCQCGFAYHCDDGPANPDNVINILDVAIGSCSALECEAYCSSVGSGLQDLNGSVLLDEEGHEEAVGQLACDYRPDAWNREVGVYYKICDLDWEYTEIHSSQLLCCDFGYYVECDSSANAEC